MAVTAARGEPTAWSVILWAAPGIVVTTVPDWLCLDTAVGLEPRHDDFIDTAFEQSLDVRQQFFLIDADQ